jgi:DNA-binding CsgD family transcriptional regulator
LFAAPPHNDTTVGGFFLPFLFIKAMTKEQSEIILKLYRTHSDREIGLAINKSPKTVQQHRRKYGLKKEKPTNTQGLTYKDKEFIKQNYMTMTQKEISQKLNYHQRTIKKHINSLYAEGYPIKPRPNNSIYIVNYPRTANKQSFQKNNIPKNTKPIGLIYWLKNRQEYMIKTKDGIVPYRRWLWEQYNGSIPAKHVIFFLDKNSKNVCFENLGMLSASEHLQKHLQTATARAKRKQSISKAKKKQSFARVYFGKN